MEPASRSKLIIKVAALASLPLSAGALFGVFTSQLALAGAFMLALLLLVAVSHLLIFLVSVPRPKVSPYTLMLYPVGCAFFLLSGVLPEGWQPLWVKDHEQTVHWSLMAAGFALLTLNLRRRKSLPSN